MNTLTRKLFSLGELRYGYLLLLSVGICVTAYYIDERMSPEDRWWLAILYYLSFTFAALWSGANYAGHIRMNRLYAKQNNIRAYVDQLAISGDDRLELFNYLEDYAADLERQGKSAEEAAREAIDQFRVREFLSMSKHTKPFESHGHHYLLGYAFLLLTAAIVLAIFGMTLDSSPLPLVIAIAVLAVYGLSFAALFALYRMLDRVLYRKLRQYFS